MPRETIGKIPEFTSEEVGETGQEEVKEPSVSTEVEEKETPAAPSAEEEPLAESKEDTGELSPELSQLQTQIQGLQEDRLKLIKELQELRGQRRELKTEELKKVEETIDALTDVHPEDVQVVERILKSKGYVTREETGRMYYESVKQEELNKFLEKYPEYKPENDPNDERWRLLNQEVGLYRQPDNPHTIGLLLEKAHRVMSGGKVSSGLGTDVKLRQVQTAGVGALGAQRSSSRKSLDPWMKEEYRRGGWSEEEIKELEQNL